MVLELLYRLSRKIIRFFEYRCFFDFSLIKKTIDKWSILMNKKNCSLFDLFIHLIASVKAIANPSFQQSLKERPKEYVPHFFAPKFSPK